MTSAAGGCDPIDLSHIRRSLEQPATVYPVEGALHAAVAMILEPSLDEHSMLFIERARRDGDPWSGQIAFPGGRREPEDADARAVAVRETYEEIGVSLAPEHCLGRLDDVRGRAGGTSEGMVISCFVFALEEPAPVRMNAEVAAVERLNVSHLVHSDNRCQVDWRKLENRLFPGIRFGQADPRVVWGLTYRFLHQFFTRLGHELPEAV